MLKTSFVAAILVVALAGCTPAEQAVEQTPPAMAEPTPIPTASVTQGLPVETGLAQPEQVFDGQCASLLSEYDASKILGTAVTIAETDPVDIFETALVWQAGGIRCTWADKAGTVALTLTAAPADAVGELDDREACQPNRRDVIGDITCGIASDENGVVVSGLVGLGGGSSSTAKKQAEKVVAALIGAVESNSIVDVAKPVTLPAELAWANPGVAPDKNPPTCADIDLAIVSGDFMGGGTRGKVEDVLPVTGYLSPLDEDLAGFLTDEPSWCSWSATRTQAEIDKGQISQLFSRELGGGAWMLDRVAASSGAKKITIDGVDRAYRYKSQSGQASIWVADGPNAASFTYYAGQKDAGYRSVALVVEALNATNAG